MEASQDSDSCYAWLVLTRRFFPGSRVPIITVLGVRSKALMRPSLKGPREAVILTPPK